MEAAIIVTYRCNARCHMCNTWQHPSNASQEILPRHLESLPRLRFANITGGEPFLRTDIDEVVAVVRRKTDRLVISTNGYLTDRIVDVARRFPDVGFRVSLEGLPTANDELRGLQDGFDHGLRTLLRLRSIGCKDIGFGITLSDRNADDLDELAELAAAMGLELATAVVHNSYYFHKFDNRIEDVERVAGRLEALALKQLRSRQPKKWFRAWFNMGLANRVRGGNRLLPCPVGEEVFFVDPFGEVRPCNGMEATMGSLKARSFDDIWRSAESEAVRSAVRECDERCWMVGSVAPAMKRNLMVPLRWIVRSWIRGAPAPVRLNRD
ncbi:MAG: radical SAM protein [Coriobacteriia bacterium]|nr:radical SAM protein [Coriobacteriia bacterium]